MLIYLASIGIVAGMLVSLAYHGNLVICTLPGIILGASSLMWKRVKERRREGEIEKELPNAITRVLTSMEAGMGFIQILKELGKGESQLAREMRIVLNQINSGVNIPLALQESGKRYKSEEYKRFINRLVMTYKYGNDPNAMKKLGESITSQRRVEIKTYLSKLIMYSLVLVAVSSIAPAMFLAFLIIGPMFMNIPFTPIDAFFLSALVFPSLDLALILAMELKRPRFM